MDTKKHKHIWPDHNRQQHKQLITIYIIRQQQILTEDSTPQKTTIDKNRQCQHQHKITDKHIYHHTRESNIQREKKISLSKKQTKENNRTKQTTIEDNRKKDSKIQ